MRRLLFRERAGEGAHFTAARVVLAARRHFVNSGRWASEHLCAKPPNSRPGDVKFTFSVYLGCLQHSTAHLHSPFQQDVKLEQTSEEHFGHCRIMIATSRAITHWRESLSQQSNSGPLRWSEAGDKSVGFHPTITFSSDWTDQNLHLIILCRSVTAGPNYITSLFQKSRHW